MTTKVQDQSPEVAEMAQDWELIHPLMEGTREMRARREHLLPKWAKEDAESYELRVKTATLYPALSRTVAVMAGKPFSKQITIGDDVPPVLREYLDNADLEGRNLHAFASALFRDVIAYGFEGVLVDYPQTSEIRTLAEERATGARPYFVHVTHEQILGWKTAKVNGSKTLTQLRLMESVEVEDGEFGVKCVDQVRVLTPGAWQIYRPNEKGEYVLFDEGTTSLDFIPFVPFYGVREEFMEGYPPLIDLAFLNVKHWQSQSDQDTIVHVARVPILFLKGFPETAQVVVGASAGVRSDSVDADMKFIEHSGAAIGAGRESLQDLEQQMIQTGAELLVQKPGIRSATESNNEHEANKCELQRIVETFEDSLDQCLQYMAAWIGLPEGGHVSLFKDYGSANLTDASAQLILSMQQGGLITKETAIREQQRRGMLSPDLDPTEELESVTTEGPTLGDMADPLDVTAPVTSDVIDPSAPVAQPSAPSAQPEPIDFAELGRTIAEAIAGIQFPAAVVNVPQALAPVVQFPAINVESPQITVNVPEQPASVVNISPPNVNVSVEKGGTVKFTEDADGNLTGAVME